jgi:ATP-dependent exoDNAse (exonuclease V) alpha subunit
VSTYQTNTSGDSAAAPQVSLTGVVERITFHSEESGYTVARLQSPRVRELTTIVGNFANIQAGQTLQLQGTWKDHLQYGQQFQVVKYSETKPATLTGIEKYLGSGLIKGVGPVTAKRIVAHFALDTLEIIEQDSDRLIEVPGIGKKGYKRENLVEFSKRRMQILAQCPANSTWQTREDSWDRTRKHKEHIPPAELKLRWQQEASDLGMEIVKAGVPTVAQPISPPIAQQYLDDAIAHCSERSVDFRVEDIEKFAIAQRLPLAKPAPSAIDIKPLCDARPDLIKLDRHYTTFKAQIQDEVGDSAEPTLRERIQVEPLLDNIHQSEAELDRQEGVKVPTHGASVKVPTHRGDVCVPTSRNFDNSYHQTL